MSEYVPAEVELIISAGAGGVDRPAEEYADKKKISKLILRPRYVKYGKAAPPGRNEKMVELCDSVPIIWDGVSPGTKYSIDYAKKQNKPIRIIEASPNV